MCGIYKIQNLINGKIYIGQSVDIDYRFRNHKSESFNPKSNAYDTAIHRAIRKYGVENFLFDIVEECCQDELREREIYWINYYGSFGNGYNLTTGGEGVPTVNIKQVQNLLMLMEKSKCFIGISLILIQTMLCLKPKMNLTKL